MAEGRQRAAADVSVASLSLRLRFRDASGLAIGPGKIELLERIRDAGSISAAARDMHMAYRRAWLLVRGLNDSFRSPVVETAKGGSGRGGAGLTALGEELVARYRRMERDANDAVADDLGALAELRQGQRGVDR